MKPRLTLIWAILVALTVISTSAAGNLLSGNTITVLVCLTVAIKGSLVADHFMGLRDAHPVARWSVQAYMIALPLIICLSLLYIESLARI